MSADNIRISHVTSKSTELSRYMATALDEAWNATRGFEIQAVGIASVSYDDESKKLINLRNQGAMLGDPSVREGYVQGAMARGFEAAGSNAGGAAQAFMGMGMGMANGGSFMAAASQSNQNQMQSQQVAAQQAAAQQAAAQQAGWTCACGKEGNTGKFCSECGKPRPEATPKTSWKCSCGKENTGKFCSECGSPKPAEPTSWFCPECGKKNEGKFCAECGTRRPD
jgi:membrane protease subunit (stomatin/prohibitin family)